MTTPLYLLTHYLVASGEDGLLHVSHHTSDEEARAKLLELIEVTLGYLEDVGELAKDGSDETVRAWLSDNNFTGSVFDYRIGLTADPT